MSGEEKLKKPDPAFFQVLFDRHALAPHDCVFIDDSLVNVEAARQLGMHALHFGGAEPLERELIALGLL
jgi:2-haloacid dehalogenase